MDAQSYSQKDVEKLFAAGAHLGHKKNRLHPKARKYVYRIEQGVSIIDLTQTAVQLTKAKKFIAEAAKNKKVMLVVATKKVISKFNEDLCSKHNIPYVSTKWLPGLLTNFQTIIKNVKKLKELKEAQEKGEWDTFVKHEKLELQRQLNKLEKFYGGLINVEKKPDFLFIVDIKKEKNAVVEAVKSGITTVAVADTNSNPETVDYPIVANDDSPESTQYLVTEIIKTYASSPSSRGSKAAEGS